jgi:hypothetical protein
MEEEKPQTEGVPVPTTPTKAVQEEGEKEPKGKEKIIATPTKVGVEVTTPNLTSSPLPLHKKADPVSAAGTLVVRIL